MGNFCGCFMGDDVRCLRGVDGFSGEDLWMFGDAPGVSEQVL